MNKNILPPILIIIAIATFFTFTRGRMDELKTISATNASYLQAIQNSVDLIKTRDAVLRDYNTLSDNDKDRLSKMLPDNVDNVRLIIDVTNIGTRHGIALKGVSANAAGTSGGTASINTPQTPAGAGMAGLPAVAPTPTYGIVNVSFSFNSSYENGMALLKDIQSSLRILDISHLTVTQGALPNSFDFAVQLQTYWLKQ